MTDENFVQTIDWANVNTDAYLTFGNTALDASSTVMVPGKGVIYWAKYWNKDLGAGECRQLAAWNHEKMYYTVEEYAGMTNGLTRKAFPSPEGVSLIVPNVVITSVNASSYGHIS